MNHRPQDRDSSSSVWTLALATLLAWPVSCGSEDVATPAPEAWQLVLQVDGQEVRLQLEGLNVFLTDDEDWPETFELRGPGVQVFGTSPDGLHVGYGEEWSRVFGRTLRIDARGGRDEAPSTVTIPGRGTLQIVGGELVPERVSGQYSDVDLTLSGRILLRTKDGEALRGTFAAHCQTWG